MSWFRILNNAVSGKTPDVSHANASCAGYSSQRDQVLESYGSCVHVYKCPVLTLYTDLES